MVERKLRTGFTTGACAATAAKAAAMVFCGEHVPNALPVYFPDGKYRNVVLEHCERSESHGVASVVKDAGDDPDVTDKAIISASFRPFEENPAPEDYVLSTSPMIILRGGEGVGLATRPGLDCECGKWAINPVPRKMILENLLSVLPDKAQSKCFLIEISVENGGELAQKTLNSTLGIMGGISILGTTGIVTPHSNSAYVETIKILVRNVSETQKNIAFCTGSRSRKALRRDIPSLPDYAIVSVADFIAEALRAASQYAYEKIIVSCMPGKLFKYALGYECTHAHKVSQDMSLIEPVLMEAGVPEDYLADALAARSMRELLEYLPPQYHSIILSLLGEKAIDHISGWAGKIPCELYCYDTSGDLPPLLHIIKDQRSLG